MKRYMKGSKEDFVVDYKIPDNDSEEYKRIAREIEDENDYYDYTHKEGKYAEVDAASKFKEVDSVRFAGGLFRKLQEYYDPEDKRIQISPQYTEITISDYNPTSDSAWGLLDHVEMALEDMGYDTYYVDADEYPYIAAIKGEACVKIYWDYTPDAENVDTMYLDLSYDNGNVIFEDWYDDYEASL